MPNTDGCKLNTMTFKAVGSPQQDVNIQVFLESKHAIISLSKVSTGHRWCTARVVSISIDYAISKHKIIE